MKKHIALSMTMVFLAACASKEAPKDVPVETRTTTPTTPTAPTTSTTGTTTPVAPPTNAAINPLKDPKNVLSQRVIYFEYDKDTLKPEFQALVQAHAKFLSDNRDRKIRLEGHADERGSREYNMALGQRRADSVRKASNLLGVVNDRMETVSFGEDKPKSMAHDEAGWALNRRVEIVYDGE